MTPDQFSRAHQQLVVVGLEVGLVLALATVATAAPGWGPPVLMLVVLLWALFLFQHGPDLQRLLAGPSSGAGGGGGGGNLTP